MSDTPVFYQDQIERLAPAILGCLARMVNQLLLAQAKGVKLPTTLQLERDKAVELIMQATRPPECPVATQQKKVVDEAEKPA